MDGLKTVAWLMVIALPFPLACAEPDILVQAHGQNDAPTPSAHATQDDGPALNGSNEIQDFDGAKTKLLVFRNQARLLRYAPPFDWRPAPGGDRTIFRKGNVTAQLIVLPKAANMSSATPAWSRKFIRETLGRVTDGESASVTTGMLPFSASGMAFYQGTVTYRRAGESYVLQRVGSWGGDWQIRVEIKGPKGEFDQVAAGFTNSLGHMEMRSMAEEQNQMFARVHAAVVPQKIPLTDEVVRHVPGARTRGRLP